MTLRWSALSTRRYCVQGTFAVLCFCSQPPGFALGASNVAVEFFWSLCIFCPEFAPNVHCYSVTKSCLTPCDSMTTTCQASLSFTICWSLLKLMSIESVMPNVPAYSYFQSHRVCILLLNERCVQVQRIPGAKVQRIPGPNYLIISPEGSPSSLVFTAQGVLQGPASMHVSAPLPHPLFSILI